VHGDLEDGVKVNYNKPGAALRWVMGLSERFPEMGILLIDIFPK